MWLANARPSPRNAANVRPRARPIIALLPNTRIIEVLPRLNPPLRRHLLQSRHRRLVPPPRPVQRRPLLRWQRLARPLIPRRRLARPPNRQVNPRRFNRGMRNTICIRNSRLQAGDRSCRWRRSRVIFRPPFRNPRSAIRIFSTAQGLDEVGETFPANLDSDTEQNERREPEKDDCTGLSQGSD